MSHAQMNIPRCSPLLYSAIFLLKRYFCLVLHNDDNKFMRNKSHMLYSSLHVLCMYVCSSHYSPCAYAHIVHHAKLKDPADDEYCQNPYKILLIFKQIFTMILTKMTGKPEWSTNLRHSSNGFSWPCACTHVYSVSAVGEYSITLRRTSPYSCVFNSRLS